MLSDLVYRLRALFRRSTVEAEMGDELRFHFEQEVNKYEKSGLPHEEALRRARLAFGGMEPPMKNTRGKFYDTHHQSRAQATHRRIGANGRVPLLRG
ncbi:MAG: permease prefix domain 1-containing protein [Bryobacteraceae bacterium]